MAEAHLLFYGGQYLSCVQCIGDASRYHPGLRIHAETLYLRACCELIVAGHDCADDFERCRDRFSKYLRDNAVLSAHKVKALRRFMLLADCLVAYHQSPRHSSRRKLLSRRIENRWKGSHTVYSAFWLQQHIQANVQMPVE